MDETTNAFDWQAAIKETFTGLTQQIIDVAPQILGAVALFAVGWLIAQGASVSTRKIVRGLDAVFKRAARSNTVNEQQIRNSYALIISKLVFWVILLFFAAVSTNILGWELFSGWMESIVNYLPGLLTGLLIILAGFLVSNVARAAILTASMKAGMAQSTDMARVVQIVILFSAIIVGVEQIGLAVDFLSSMIVVIVGTLLAGVTLAFGLGARALVANIIGAQYTRRHCQPGEIMKIDGIEGEILEITQSTIVLDTGSGRAVIPARKFQEEVSQFITGTQRSSSDQTS